MKTVIHYKIIIATLCLTIFIPSAAQNNTDSTSLIIPNNVETTLQDTHLSEKDYQEVAQELGIEVAAIKAVIEIEAGNKLKGFQSPGKPIINFDVTMFRRFLRANKISAAKYSTSHSTAFNKANTKKYGCYIKAQYARLESAREINEEIANKATFWGMFQIGGFNWKTCGTNSVDDFVAKMSESEHSQLKLFVAFLVNSNMVKYLKAKNWNAFARVYNGSLAIKRGYHTKLARAYAKHSK